MTLAGRTGDAERLLGELQARSRIAYVSPYQIASVYAALHRNDDALAWIDKAIEARSWYVTGLLQDPNLDALRADPRFAARVRAVGLPAAN